MKVYDNTNSAKSTVEHSSSHATGLTFVKYKQYGVISTDCRDITYVYRLELEATTSNLPKLPKLFLNGNTIAVVSEHMFNGLSHFNLIE